MGDRLMPKTWKLTQTKQCSNCPWRKDSDLSRIPGYSRQQHLDLVDTIVDNGILNLDRPVKFMGCHNSTDDKDLECIGWLNNQLRCNNIGLRWRMMTCENSEDIETTGEQYLTFEETL